MEILRLCAFTDNYIWGLRHQGRVAIIDPGEAAPVLAHLDSSGDRLCAFLLTHHHGDHIGGLGELLARESVPVYGPARVEIPEITHALKGGETIDLPELDCHLQVLPVPGHTRDHLAYYGSKHLFCGDTLFNLGCGRLFEGSPAQMHASLESLAALPGDTGVYCAHEYTYLNLPFALEAEPGNPTLQARATVLRRQIAAGIPTVPATLAEEFATNPFLRCDAPEIIATAERLASMPLASSAEVFATLRSWRNDYKPPVSLT